MMKTSIIAACIAVVLVPYVVSAGPIIRTGELVSVDATQSLKGDFYGFGGTVTVSGQSENDAVLGGGTVTVNAPVAEDLTIAGGVVQVHTSVGDDLRVIGGEVTLAEDVSGDVVVFGGSLTILSTAEVGGDVIFMGQALTIDGKVAGSIHGGAETARINAEVGGDISLRVGELLTLGEHTNALGSITYESQYDLVRAQNAVVVGDVRKVDSAFSDDHGSRGGAYLFEIGIILFAALSLFVVARRHTVSVAGECISHVGLTGFVGLGMLITLPFVSAIFFVSIVGAYIAGVVLVGYVLLIMLAFAIAPIVVGRALERIVRPTAHTTFVTVCVGALACFLTAFIPYVGGVLVFAYVVVTLGGIGMVVYRALRS